MFNRLPKHTMSPTFIVQFIVMVRVLFLNLVRNRNTIANGGGDPWMTQNAIKRTKQNWAKWNSCLSLLFIILFKIISENWDIIRHYQSQLQLAIDSNTVPGISNRNILCLIDTNCKKDKDCNEEKNSKFKHQFCTTEQRNHLIHMLTTYLYKAPQKRNKFTCSSSTWKVIYHTK